MAILILGAEDDEHAAHMREHLLQRGADVELLDSRWFPAELGISFDPGQGRGLLGLPSGRCLAFDEVSAVYWRSYHGVRTPRLPDPEQDFIAQNDARGLFESMLIRLPARWVNGWRAYTLHQTKPAQLAMVAMLGVRVPETLITNSPEELTAFVARREVAIFKPVQGGAHTRLLTPAHLSKGNLESLRIAPVTVQERVPGTNIRIFVAGERVLACELVSEHLDYREDGAPNIRPHTLPQDMKAMSLRIARALDLVWTGMDFRLTPEGTYVFLEANPSPMFLGFERLGGLTLTGSLGDLLLGVGLEVGRASENREDDADHRPRVQPDA